MNLAEIIGPSAENDGLPSPIHGRRDELFTITGPTGDIIVLDPGNTDLRYQADTFQWTVNWQTKDALGADLPPGPYDIKITTNKTGRRFRCPEPLSLH